MMAILTLPALQRLGLVLLHSLWELALIALAVRIGLGLLRGPGASARYRLALAGLAAMVAVPVLTWFCLTTPSSVSAALVPEGAALMLAAPVTAEVSSSAGLVGLVHRLAPWLALGWFLGAALMLGRLGAGLWWLERAYLRKACPAPEAWQRALDRLALRMGVTGRVRLLESRQADSPLVLGWLKPAILVPSAALLHLSPAALEAVLAHEMAHIRRADYLINLLQSFSESLLFFHPCAWWLSRTIRELREHCCDDAAAALCGDPILLAEGLSALERLRRGFSPDPEPALAAARGNLMSRITRLFLPAPAPSTSLRGLAAALVGATVLSAAALAAHRTPDAATPSGQAGEPAPNRLRILRQPPAPPYPSAARAHGVQGALALRLIVSPDGTPGSVEVIQGTEELRATATAYAQGWRFQLPAGADPEFRLNLIYTLKGTEGPSAEAMLASLPKAPGASATVQILAAAKTEPPQAEARTQDVDFSQIKVTHQPPAPAYPAEAKIARIQGTVVVELVIDEQGVPISARALEGPPQLAPTAVDYAKAWRFQPAQVKGQTVKARFKLTMPFRLREDAPAPKVSQGRTDTTPGKPTDTEFARIKILHQPPPPAYPAEAKARGIQGIVEIEIIVDEKGVPVGVKALSGPEELRPVAMAYAEDWRFKPFQVDGKPAKARFKLTMPFKLK